MDPPDFIVFQGNVVTRSEEECHLGIVIGVEVNRRRVQQIINDLYKRTNLLLAQFRFANYETRYTLFKSYCMSLYGYQLLDISKPYIEDLFVAWRKCIRSILCLPYRTHSDLLPEIINDVSIQVQLEKRLVKFIHGIMKSSNKFVELTYRLFLSGSASPIGKGLTVLCAKYHWDRYSMPHLNQLLENIVGERIQIGRVGAQIRELINMREDNNNNFLSRGEINDVLHFLCTS